MHIKNENGGYAKSALAEILERPKKGKKVSKREHKKVVF